MSRSVCISPCDTWRSAFAADDFAASLCSPLICCLGFWVVGPGKCDEIEVRAFVGASQTVLHCNLEGFYSATSNVPTLEPYTVLLCPYIVNPQLERFSAARWRSAFAADDRAASLCSPLICCLGQGFRNRQPGAAVCRCS